MTQQQTNLTALLTPPFYVELSGSMTLPCLWMLALLPPHSQVPMLAAQHLLPSVSVAWVQPAGNIRVSRKTLYCSRVLQTGGQCTASKH